MPVYRKIDDEDNMGKNKDSFKKGYEILENNGAFLIFPEGVSIGKRVLEKLGVWQNLGNKPSPILDIRISEKDSNFHLHY